MTTAISAFLWHTDIRPSIFASDTSFKANNKKSKAMVKAIDAKRKKGLSPGTIRGLSKRSEEMLIANNRFSTYLKDTNE
jgi:hypothetical protein